MHGAQAKNPKLFVAVAAIALASFDSLAATRYVRASEASVDAGDCTARDNPCRTIEYAVDVSGETFPDLILIAGDFSEVVTLDRPVRLQGTSIASGSDAFEFCSGDTCPSLTSLDDRSPLTVAAGTTANPVVVESVNLVDAPGDAVRAISGVARFTDVNFLDNARAILVSESATIEVSRSLFERNGDDQAAGGAIHLSGGSADISFTVFRANSAQNGGAIFAAENASAAVDTSVFVDNRATFSGGALAASGSSLTIGNSLLAENRASETGGAVWAQDTQLNVSDCSFDDNWALKSGGAISARSSASLIQHTDLLDNAIGNSRGSDIGGGAIEIMEGELTVEHTLFSDNLIADAEFFGGGVGTALLSRHGARATILDSRLTRNSGLTTASGRVIWSDGELIIERSELVNNFGSGIAHSKNANVPTVLRLSLKDTTVSGHRDFGVSTAAAGIGAIVIESSTLTDNDVGLNVAVPDAHASIVNSTLSGNGTNLVATGDATLLFSTLASASGASLLATELAAVNIDSSIVAGACETTGSASITLLGGTAYDQNSCGPAPVADLGLVPLAQNGGPTPTHRLLASSPAVDAGRESCENEPTGGVDQRGVSRPFGSRCDLGAFELTDSEDAIFSDGFE